ncbi:FGGY-family carbohydrate kinase [Thorsellia anophelis]|uniref:Ribulokinase n=1 Tax=Thorsellia anophelis DSM 18579 TaxID=1123402 RepID=A0A1I0B968_9GAMM|nr:FGGY-family carbohydrate kinase [Thorsellia anophelis]SET03306.1 ribulokinase [Thorsellia anophelis DSM 18579]
MQREYFIGVDVGSGSARAGIYDKDGKRIAFDSRNIQQFHYKELYVEQSSNDIWSNVCAVVKNVLKYADVKSSQIKSIGFDATCSLVALDKNDEPISMNIDSSLNEQNIIMWMDHRAGKQVDLINATEHEVLKYVGGEINIEMEIPKILWLQQFDEARYKKVGRFFDLSDFLVFKATGNPVGSVCTLTCKWNYLAHEKRFSDDFLAAIGLTSLKDKLPKKVLDVGEMAGYLNAIAAAELGLDEGVVVSSGLIDAHAGGLALVGANPDRTLSIISGTSNCHMIVNPSPVFVPGVWGPYYSAMIPNLWLSEGGQSAAGALVDWTIRQNEHWPILEEESTKRNISVYQVLNEWVLSLEKKEKWPTMHLHVLADHHGNRSPRSNPNARGVTVGLTLEHSKDSLARIYLATLQAIAYGTKHIILEMKRAMHNIQQITLCGGASKNPIWLREYANITMSPIYLSEEEDAVTLGAAINGAVASGFYSNIQVACQHMVRFKEPIMPDSKTNQFHLAKYDIYNDLYEQMMSAQKRMETFKRK